MNYPTTPTPGVATPTAPTQPQTPEQGPALGDFPLSAYPNHMAWLEDVAQTYLDQYLELDLWVSAFLEQPPDHFPKNWVLPTGWSKYDLGTARWESPEGPQDDGIDLMGWLPKILCIDIEAQETQKGNGDYRPTLLIAYGIGGWYAWRWGGEGLPKVVPFPPECIVLGHNVRAHDAKYLSCSYDVNGTTFYLDTRWLAKVKSGIEGDAQYGLYKQCQKLQEKGKGHPEWYSHATRLDLATLSLKLLGEPIYKGVKRAQANWGLDDLKEHLLPKLPLEIQQQVHAGMGYDQLINLAVSKLETFAGLAPTSLAQYCAQDVFTSYRLAQYLYPHVKRHFMAHPASWLGIHEYSQCKSLVNGLDEANEWEAAVWEETQNQLVYCLDMARFEVNEDNCPDLDWTKLKSGPNKGEPRWLVEYQKANHSPDSRAALDVLRLTWQGSRIRWQKGKGWATEEGLLPHPEDPTKPLKTSPLQPAYARFVESGELASEWDGFRGLLDILRVYQAGRFDYASVYTHDGGYGLCSVEGLQPLANLAHAPELKAPLEDLLAPLDGCVLVRIQTELSDRRIANAIAGTVQGKVLPVPAFTPADTVLLRGGTAVSLARFYQDSEKVYEDWKQANRKVEGALTPLHEQSAATSVLLRCRMSEALDPQWCDRGFAERRAWLIDSFRVDFNHMLLSALAAFKAEFEFDSVLSYPHPLCWMVPIEQAELFQKCLHKAHWTTAQAAREAIASKLRESDPELSMVQPIECDLGRLVVTLVDCEGPEERQDES